MKTLKYLVTCLTLFLATATYATSWDEPWQEEILSKSESFVLLKVDSIDQEKGIWATVIRNLAGTPVNGHIQIKDFFALRLTSTSGGHGPEFRLPPMDTAYFFW